MDEALELATRTAQEREQRLAACERLLTEERDARRRDLERVLDALGRQPTPYPEDVAHLAELAEQTAGELRRRYDHLRRLRYP